MYNETKKPTVTPVPGTLTHISTSGPPQLKYRVCVNLYKVTDMVGLPDT